MNSFKSKTQHFLLKLANAVKRNPVEVGLSLVYAIMACIEEAHNIFYEHSFFVYAPALFLFSHLMNKISLSTKFRVLYHISFLPIIPLLFDFPVEAEICFVTTVIIQLAYLIVNRKTKNDSFFISETLNFLFSVASAALLSLVSWLLMISIVYSINYIFDMSIGWNFESYMGLLSLYAVFPLLFLVFDNETEDAVYDMKSGNKLFDILFNYVLSPALLVYAFIICL